MSDDDRHGPDDDHEPHGVVETLREEIEEAVEHVPQPVRWTVGKLTRLALLVLAGLMVLGVASAILYFMNRTELVARELSLLLNRTLREHSDLVLELRDIRGNPRPHPGCRVRWRPCRVLPLISIKQPVRSKWNVSLELPRRTHV